MEFSLLTILILVIAALHLWFLILEMFLWTTPIGAKVFRLSPDFAQKTASLAANQGLYNGFLVAGLIWSVFANEPFARELKLFFLSCVLIAGIFGAFTVSKRIFFIQALPALIALMVLLFA